MAVFVGLCVEVAPGVGLSVGVHVESLAMGWDDGVTDGDIDDES